MGLLSNRIEREKTTLLVMLRMYCGAHHDTETRNSPEGFCTSCLELRDYALRRLEACPFAAKKPTCEKCPVHCYKPEMRERVRAAMRYAGPRMLLRHPVLAILHLLTK
jgi:predicted amidophosphoribosyltransferase